MTAAELEGLINMVLNSLQVMFLAWLAARYRQPTGGPGNG